LGCRSLSETGGELFKLSLEHLPIRV